MTEERIKELARKTPFGWTQEHTETKKQLIRTVAAEARKEGIDEIEKIWQTAKEEISEIRHRLFRLSDLHDNMDHWMKMQEMNSDLQDKVVEPIYRFFNAGAARPKEE